MANEAILLVKLEPAIPTTVTDGTGIEKGSLMNLADLNTGALSATAAEELSGIAASEKIASDGKATLGVIKRGVFKMYCSGAVNVGRAVQSAADANYPNHIEEAAVTSSGSSILGHALETGATTEQIMVMVDVGAGGNQIS